MIDRLDPASDKVHFRIDTSFWVCNLMISANFIVKGNLPYVQKKEVKK